MAAAMKMPATMEIHSKDIWVCKTTESNHFMKRKDGAYSVTGNTGGNIDVSHLMDFTVTHHTKEGVEGNTFK